MASSTGILLTGTILALLFLNPLVVGSTASPHRECKAELVALSLVSSPPNHVTAAVSPKCCDAITSLFNPTGVESGICHLLRDPPSFGVPLNTSGVLFLLSVCLDNTTRSLECPSVDEFSGEFVSEFEDAIRKCDVIIHSNCAPKEEHCCRILCERRLPHGKTIDVSLKVINNSLVCYCHVIYQDKPNSCVIMLNF